MVCLYRMVFGKDRGWSFPFLPMKSLVLFHEMKEIKPSLQALEKNFRHANEEMSELLFAKMKEQTCFLYCCVPNTHFYKTSVFVNIVFFQSRLIFY